MKALCFPCHMCGSHDSEVVTPAFLADGSFCKFQEIVICRNCGLVYKNPVIPDLNKLVYSRTSWGDGSVFKKRIDSLVSYLLPELADARLQTIMEIGPGPGWLCMTLQESFASSKFILFEASEDVAAVAKQNLPTATVIPAGIDEAYIDDGVVDLALVCGVDYLFADFRRTIDKISRALSSDGYLYIERNVFVESEAYAGFPIKNNQGLFGKNALMTTWFAVSQYKQFLSMLFDVVSERSFLHDETDGHKCVIQGFLCKKRIDGGGYYRGTESWYEANIASLSRLSREIEERPSASVAWRSRLRRLFRRVNAKF